MSKRYRIPGTGADGADAVESAAGGVAFAELIRFEDPQGEIALRTGECRESNT